MRSGYVLTRRSLTHRGKQILNGLRQSRTRDQLEPPGQRVEAVSELESVNYDDDLEGWPGNGVVMQEGNIAASYNALNQPNWIWSANVTGGFVSFGFDPLGRCVKRWGSGSDPATNPATYFYYDVYNAERTPELSLTERIRSGGEQPMGE